MADSVILLGDARLRIKCENIDLLSDTSFKTENDRLKAALDGFRKEKGFGRGIAAPQIGILKRFIALNFGKETFTLINPVITWHSEETFTLWDDCMSFPDLLIKLKRYKSMDISYQDESGKTFIWEKLSLTESELLQHEIDHLDGILAIDRALDNNSIIYRKVFEENKAYFESLVDYVIIPTI